jgi:hypothetical protein
MKKTIFLVYWLDYRSFYILYGPLLNTTVILRVPSYPLVVLGWDIAVLSSEQRFLCKRKCENVQKTI